MQALQREIKVKVYFFKVRFVNITMHYRSKIGNKGVHTHKYSANKYIMCLYLQDWQLVYLI